MKIHFTVFAIAMIGTLFSDASSAGNYDDKVVTDFIDLIVSDEAVSLKDYKNFRYIDPETEFQFEVMKCRENGWNPYSDRCAALNHIYNPRVNSFFMEWVKERFSTSGQDYEIISSVFVKHAANVDDFWLVEILIGEYTFILERYTPRTAMGDLVLLQSAYNKDGSYIPYGMNLPSSCHRGVYTGIYDLKVNDALHATLDLLAMHVVNKKGTGSISITGNASIKIDISWVYLTPDVVKIESKRHVSNNRLSNTLRQIAERIYNADLTPFEARSVFGLYADCKHGVINGMYFYSNKDVLFFKRRAMMPDIVKDPQILLHNAVQEGDITEVMRLLKAGVDINAKIHYHSFLSLAIFKGYTEVVQALIDAGADVNANSGIALKIAEKEGRMDVIQVLKNAGAK